MAKYKVVIIGVAHMHCMYLALDTINNPDLEMSAFSDTASLTDEPEELVPFTRKWNKVYLKDRLGIRFYDSYTQMLDEIKPDLAIISTETCLHPEVVEECAKRGITVSMEKPMAVSYAEALKMVRIQEKYGTEILVNWPMAWMPFMPVYKKLLAEGRIGRIVKMHTIVGHPGPLGPGVRHPQVDETSDKTTMEQKARTWWHTASLGGGAMLDFCGYGAMACNYLADEKAVSAMGMRANTMHQLGDADDNAVMMVRYPSFIATLEGSWTIPIKEAGNPPGPTVWGTKGMMKIVPEDGKIFIEVIGFDGSFERIEAPTPKPELANVQAAFVHHKETGKPLPVFLNIYENLDVMGILDAGVKSAVSGEMEMVQSRAYGNR